MITPCLGNLRGVMDGLMMDRSPSDLCIEECANLHPCRWHHGSHTDYLP